jgi:hypothetical protein
VLVKRDLLFPPLARVCCGKLETTLAAGGTAFNTVPLHGGETWVAP